MNRNDVKIAIDAPPKDLWDKKLRLLKKFNYECGSDKERLAVLKELLGRCYDDTRITPLFYCDFGCNIYLGKQFYSNYNFTVLDCGKVTIGDHVFIAPNVDIYAVGHPTDKIMRRIDYEYCAPVEIGDDVWIGGRTVINPGVSIGNNVVIGSGSVVTHDIGDGVIAAGNPCRVLRKIGDKDRQFFFKDFEYERGVVEAEYIKAGENI